MRILISMRRMSRKIIILDILACSGNNSKVIFLGHYEIYRMSKVHAALKNQASAGTAKTFGKWPPTSAGTTKVLNQLSWNSQVFPKHPYVYAPGLSYQRRMYRLEVSRLKKAIAATSHH